MKKTSPIITLTTDFGYKDPFIAEMKGVILSINPDVTVVDITHDIEPFNIMEAAIIIGSSYKYFPPGTIHIAVVDPGVGYGRRPMIIEADRHLFVGPDNGLFSMILQGTGTAEHVEIVSERYVLRKESPTFQGRDIFAPAAACLSRGVALPDFGARIDDPLLISIPRPRLTEGRLAGEILHIDRFGNAITNITEKDLALLGRSYRGEVKGRTISPVTYYGQGEKGSLNCLINSSGHLELFSNCGNASNLFGIVKGDILYCILQD